jgi:hypothetical protein
MVESVAGENSWKCQSADQPGLPEPRDSAGTRNRGGRLVSSRCLFDLWGARRHVRAGASPEDVNRRIDREEVGSREHFHMPADEFPLRPT